MSIDIDPATGAPIIIPDSTIEPIQNESLTAAQSLELAKSNATLGTPDLSNVEFVEPVTHVQPTESAVINSLPLIPPHESTEDIPVSELRPITEFTPKELILNKMNDIIDQWNGISNIPVTSEYWDLLKQYRGMK